MPLIAELQFDSPLVEELSNRWPNITIDIHDRYRAHDREHIITWVGGPGPEELRTGLADSDLIESVHMAAEVNGEGVCTFVISPLGERFLVTPVMRREQVMVLEASGKNGAITAKVSIPNRHVLQTLATTVREWGGQFQLKRLYRTEGDHTATILTPAQHETLITAYEMGYFDEPRQISLAELGEIMGVSQGAVSGRIRRGVKRLVAQLTKPPERNPPPQ